SLGWMFWVAPSLGAPWARGPSQDRAAPPTRLCQGFGGQAGRRLQIEPSILMVASSLTHCLRRLCEIGGMRGIGIVSLHIFEVGSKIQRFGGTGAGVGKAGEGEVVRIDRAQSGCARASDVGRRLQHVQLCSQSGSKILSGHVERLIRRLQVLCFTLEYAVGLLKIEKSAADFRGNCAPCCCQSLHRCLTP